ncbi:hypothetical protein [Zavarzinia aquatilis]|uniref:hypothetical protein n=1 Tax=Zavarzinia aquatilis TaxID=2211142 RepID=UPI001057A6F4|nr:hypothetical protein [Zavarzinia aquatilis]
MWTLDIEAEADFRTGCRLAQKGCFKPQLDGAVEAGKCQYGRDGCDGGNMIRFARIALLILSATGLLPTNASAETPDYFVDGVYQDFGAAWYKATYAVFGKGLTFPEQQDCDKDQRRPGEVSCFAGNDNYDMLVSGKAPMEGKGVRSIMVAINSYKNIALAKNLTKVIAGVIDRSLIDDWKFSQEVDRALLAEKTNVIFRTTLRVVVDPLTDEGGISILVIPPQELPPKPR